MAPKGRNALISRPATTGVLFTIVQVRGEFICNNNLLRTCITVSLHIHFLSGECLAGPSSDGRLAERRKGRADVNQQDASGVVHASVLRRNIECIAARPML